MGAGPVIGPVNQTLVAAWSLYCCSYYAGRWSWVVPAEAAVSDGAISTDQPVDSSLDCHVVLVHRTHWSCRTTMLMVDKMIEGALVPTVNHIVLVAQIMEALIGTDHLVASYWTAQTAGYTTWEVPHRGAPVSPR